MPQRRTKIVATLGPATSSAEVVGRLMDAGLDVARLNASHGDSSTLQPQLDVVRKAAEDAGRVVGVMLDLGGPKLRVGDVREGVNLTAGQEFTIETGECLGDESHACVTYKGFSRDLHSGDRVLLDDGKLQLRVRAVHDGQVETQVEIGGPLKSRKGVNVPGVRLGIQSITDKDERDLAWGLDAGVDLVAQSFVRGAEDVERLRTLMGERRVPIVAKIEKYEAVQDLEAVVEAADVIMVARGDLGVETSPEDVPVIQRRIVELCRRTGTPVIIATQMLESMTTAPRPTRAEASDVANAIFSGADAVMLSGETAVGDYPVEAVATMHRIAMTAEPVIIGHLDGTGGHRLKHAGDVTQAVSSAACELSEALGLMAVLTPTQSGATARAVASHRPSTRLIAVTPVEKVARALALVWGVTPLVTELSGGYDEMLKTTVQAARDAGMVSPGDLVAITAGLAVGQPGATDSIQVRTVP